MDPKTLTDEQARKAQDDEIFARARLVNTGFFMQMVLGDYVGAILGLVRDGLDWRLDPLSVCFIYILSNKYLSTFIINSTFLFLVTLVLTRPLTEIDSSWRRQCRFGRV